MKILFWHLYSVLCWSSIRISSANVSTRPQTNDQILRISTKHSPPFMYQDRNGSFYRGMEFELVQMMAKILNMSLRFQTASKRSNICLDVAMNASDICIGGMFPREDILKFSSMSVTYASDELTWCVRKADLMPMYLVLPLIMQPATWLLSVFGALYPSGFLLYLLIQFDRKYEQRNNHDSHYTTWLVIFPGILGFSSNYSPMSGKIRFVYAFFLFTTFFYFQLVFSRLHEFLHIQIPWHQVSTFNELIENDFKLIGSPVVFNLLNRSKKISEGRLESFDICDEISECFISLLNQNNIAFGGSRQNIFNSPFDSASKVFCFEDLDNIATYPIALYMRRDFHLNDKVNEILQRLLEAGYFAKWERGSQRKGKYEDPYTIPLQLPVAHIGAALLFIYGVGCSLSVSTFLLENIVCMKMKQKRIRRFWIYVEQLVDGQRHYAKNLPERLELQNRHSEIPFPYLD